jgi:hypothetical protein
MAAHVFVPDANPEEPESFRIGPATDNQNIRCWLCPKCDLGCDSPPYACTRDYLEGGPECVDEQDCDFHDTRNGDPQALARRRFWLYTQAANLMQPPPGVRIQLPRCVVNRITVPVCVVL